MSIEIYNNKNKPEGTYVVRSGPTIAIYTADEILELSDKLASICANIIQYRTLVRSKEYEETYPGKDFVCAGCGDWNDGKEVWWKEKALSGPILCDWCKKRRTK